MTLPAPISKTLNDVLVSPSTFQPNISAAFDRFRSIFPEEVLDLRGVYLKFELSSLKLFRLETRYTGVHSITI